MYNLKIDLHVDYGDGLINWGLAIWVDTSLLEKELCRWRLFEVTFDAWLVVVDTASGLPCQTFSDHNEMNLRTISDFERETYHITSPPTIVNDIIVVRSAINDNTRAHMASGVVR